MSAARLTEYEWSADDLHEGAASLDGQLDSGTVLDLGPPLAPLAALGEEWYLLGGRGAERASGARSEPTGLRAGGSAPSASRPVGADDAEQLARGPHAAGARTAAARAALAPGREEGHPRPGLLAARGMG